MKKFIALYMAPTAEMDTMMKNSSPEDMKKGMEEWNKWFDDRKKHFTDPGMPLGKNKRVTKDGISDTRNEVGGYSILQAESHEAAAKLLEDSPHFQIPGAYIDVLPIVEMPS